MLKQQFTLHDFTREKNIRGKKLQNQKLGHFSLFRSLLHADWTRDPIKLALWIRLLAEASFKARTVTFGGKEWALQPGELVTTCAILGSRIYPSRGNPLDRRAVARLLKFFENEGMLSVKTKGNTSIIYLINYCDYQEIDGGSTLDLIAGGDVETQNPPQNMVSFPASPSASPSGSLNASPSASLEASHNKASGGDGGSPFASPDASPEASPDASQNNNDLNTDLKRISSSRKINGRSETGSRSTIHPDAAIQSPSGKFWGTADDLKLAEWMFSKILEVIPTTKKPSWSAWANDLRLLRLATRSNHREIAQAFKWANKDGFWQTNVLSPSKLRRHWETIFPKSQQVSAKPTVSVNRPVLDFDNSDWAEGLEL